MQHTPKQYAQRRQKLRKSLSGRKGAALLITCENNVRYLTGFSGDDSYLVVDSESDTLISDPRYDQQIGEECPGLETHIRKPSERLLGVTAKLLDKRGYDAVLVEAEHLSLAAFEQLQQSCLPLEACRGEVERLREIKDAGEIKILRRAVRIAEDVFTSVRAQLTSQ